MNGHAQPNKSVLIIGTVRETQKDLDALSQQGWNFITVSPAANREEMLQSLQNVTNDITIIMMFMPWNYGPLNAEVFERFTPSLKFVSGIGAGYDLVDTDYLTQKGIYYSNTPTAVCEPTAMTTVMLILQTVRNALAANNNVKKGLWTKDLPFSADTNGLVVGIIGMGAIGKMVRDRVTALGMKVIYSNRRRLPTEEENGAEFVELDELLTRARLVTLHCPLTPQTRHLLSDEQFAKMQDNSFVVNTSRGPVIDEEALVRAMQSGKILRCGLDVFENEPAVHPWLLETDRAILFPHWAVAVEGIWARLENENLQNVQSWIKNGVPNTPVNRPNTVV